MADPITTFISGLSGAVFSLGGILIYNHLSSGRVTDEYLKKVDFDKHIDECCIKQLKKDFVKHEISHGTNDTFVSQNLQQMHIQLTKQEEKIDLLLERRRKTDSLKGED